jgi:SAM-dependent methyltransferase
MKIDSGYHFTDENTQIHKGEEARQLLAEVNDAAYLSDGQGVVKVPEERWRAAQRFERKGWMENWAGATDDRNYDHMRKFDGYRALHGRSFEHAIELGCGPFTNARLIGGKCSIREITLLDPLIESYLTLPNVSYSRTALRTVRPLGRWGHGGHGLLRRAARKACRLVPPLGAGSIPIHELLDTPIELMPDRSRAYDLVILINVIEHCLDVQKIFDLIVAISRPRAVLVFHDHLYNHDTVARMVQGHHYEAGHPLMVDRKVIEGFYHRHYTPLYERYSSESIDGHPFMKEHQNFYFISELKS